MELRTRAKFVWDSFREGLPSLWWVIGLVALFVGGSFLAYVAFALNRPVLASAILAAALILAVIEGAYRLHDRTEKNRKEAQGKLDAISAQAPVLSFERAVIPTETQRVQLGHLDGALPIVFDGRVIRVPVLNAQGAPEAKQVHARLTFLAGEQGFGPTHPAQGEWFDPNGDPQYEIDLPGNGRARLLDVVMVVEGGYPNCHEWTVHSRAARLAGEYEIKANPVAVKVEVMGSGPTAPHVENTLIVDIRDGLLVADWENRSQDESTNWVAFPMRGAGRP